MFVDPYQEVDEVVGVALFPGLPYLGSLGTRLWLVGVYIHIGSVYYCVVLINCLFLFQLREEKERETKLKDPKESSEKVINNMVGSTWKCGFLCCSPLETILKCIVQEWGSI